MDALPNLAEQGVRDAPVDLRYGRDVAEAPDEGTLVDAASSVLVLGDNGLAKMPTNRAAVQS